MKYIIIPIVLFAIGFNSVKNQTEVNSSQPKPNLDDTLMYQQVQAATFQYFWNGAEPNSGLARERIHLDGVYNQNDQNVVTSGGGGFGIMALLVGAHRGFVTRADVVERLERIMQFLEKADRFHGAWPHWWHGETGKVKPFSKKDDGGDLVESSFLAQGLLCVRQYFSNGNRRERKLAERADKLWKEIDFDFYRNGKNVLFWHWSPQYGWEMNFPVSGYNECLIMYILAVASPTHGVDPVVYHEGWAKNGGIKKEIKALGYDLQLSHNGATEYGGPLFWAHYSYLGLDPRGLKDKYADYWKENVHQSLINYQWCVNNPLGFKGYGKNSWGLTSSYSVKGYAGHAPGEKRDRGVIAPTAALSSMPYTPKESMQALKYWYTEKKSLLFGEYGFYDAFSETANWYPQRYLAIDQGPIVVMMENHRSGLIWNLFMSAPEIKTALKKLEFESPWLK